MGVQTQHNSLILNSCEGVLFAVNLRVVVSNVGTKYKCDHNEQDHKLFCGVCGNGYPNHPQGRIIHS